MFVIANNITTRHPEVKNIFRQAYGSSWNPAGQAAEELKEMALQCVKAGADALEIDIQQHYDTPEAAEFAVNAVQEATDIALCISSHSPETIEAGLKNCKKPPIINYVSTDTEALAKTLPLAAKYGSEVVLLVSEPSSPLDVKDMFNKAAILMGAAGETGIKNEKLLFDPGLIHIGHDVGQRHMVEVMKFLEELFNFAEPPVRSTCWLSNVSSGVEHRLRSKVEETALAMLAGSSLDTVFLNVLDPNLNRTTRLIKVFRNETVYSDAYIEG
jgi:5-methyltetrahydrofolate corrinoid/iron sulfur protein methyltransferase